MLYQPITLIGRIVTRVYSSERTILREMYILLPVPWETADRLQTLLCGRKQKCLQPVFRVKYVSFISFRSRNSLSVVFLSIKECLFRRTVIAGSSVSMPSVP